MHPSEIAREVFKRLAERKLLPTPANYQDLYNEIAHLPNKAFFPDAPLRRVVQALTARNRAQKDALNLLDAAIGRYSWQGIEQALTDYDKASPVSHEIPPPASSGPADTVDESGPPVVWIRELLHQVAILIESLNVVLQSDDDRFEGQLKGILEALRNPDLDVEATHAELIGFSHRASYIAEEQAEIKHSLLKLLHLIIENIGKLTLADSWLDGQIKALLDAIRPPISLRRLDDVERRIQDVMYKQAAAKERSLEAQEEMRQMLGAFIEHLNEMNDSSAAFQEQIEATAKRVEQVKTVEELAPILKEVMSATSDMAKVTEQSRQQLKTMQDKVLATEAEIAKLHLELDTASALARHDPLTNTLNRKGLDEALKRELAVMRRKNTPLSLALLDLDNFKKINDEHGHDTGDRALIHLVTVVRESIRPIDSVARYGGEEFVILMPDAELKEAIQAMTRLQRELTKKFFLSGNEKILITFSAGVTQLAAAEEAAYAIKRADEAMYLAKRSGKNRVMAG